MTHIALYRAWRPQTFKEIVGQDHITQTLQNALKEQRLTHAYLFSGPRGTGKTSAAKILAKAINCGQPSNTEPCNACSACIRITDGSVMDVLEIDGASNRGVEEIRDIRDKVKFAPTEVKRKVYIIDEVHMLTTEAFNALLKTLEEPPAHVMFILATTEPYRLPATIISRCQRFDFRRVKLEDQLDRLQHICQQEGIDGDEEALHYIARLSDGGMRDALSLLDQIVSFAGNHITYENVVAVTGGIASAQFAELASAIADRDVGAALELLDRLMQEGKSAEKSIEHLLYYFRDLLMVKMIPNSQAIAGRIVHREILAGAADVLTQDQIFRIIDILNHYQVEMKYASQPQTLFEVALMKVCCMQRYEGDDVRPSDGLASRADASVATTEDTDRELAVLTRKLALLEEKFTEWAKGIAMRGETQGSIEVGAAGEPARPLSSGSTASSSAEVQKSPTRSAPLIHPQTASPGMVKSIAGLDGFIEGRESPWVKQVVQTWSKILGQVREQKITVHAWLIDGEPVSALEDRVLVAFKNSIHRETTEKPANKQLIEQVMGELLGKPLKLFTVMLKEWNEATAESVAADAEPLQLVHDDAEGGQHKEEWINEAIELFGEQLVVIKED